MLCCHGPIKEHSRVKVPIRICGVHFDGIDDLVILVGSCMMGVEADGGHNSIHAHHHKYHNTFLGRQVIGSGAPY